MSIIDKIYLGIFFLFTFGIGALIYYLWKKGYFKQIIDWFKTNITNPVATLTTSFSSPENFNKELSKELKDLRNTKTVEPSGSIPIDIAQAIFANLNNNKTVPIETEVPKPVNWTMPINLDLSKDIKQIKQLKKPTLTGNLTIDVASNILSSIKKKV